MSSPVFSTKEDPVQVSQSVSRIVIQPFSHSDGLSGSIQSVTVDFGVERWVCGKLAVHGARCEGIWKGRRPGLSVCMSACLSVFFSVFLSASLSVCMYVCLSVCIYVCLSVCMYVCLSVCMYVCKSIYLSVSLSLSLRQSACLSICLSVCFLDWFQLVWNRLVLTWRENLEKW